MAYSIVFGKAIATASFDKIPIVAISMPVRRADNGIEWLVLFEKVQSVPASPTCWKKSSVVSP